MLGLKLIHVSKRGSIGLQGRCTETYGNRNCYKPLLELVMTNFTDVYMRDQALMS